jgi:hypothetical protein
LRRPARRPTSQPRHDGTSPSPFAGHVSRSRVCVGRPASTGYDRPAGRSWSHVIVPLRRTRECATTSFGPESTGKGVNENDELPTADRLLGGLIDGMGADPAAFAPLLDRLRPEDFARESSRAVFRAVDALHRQGQQVDLVTLYEHLNKAAPDRRVWSPVDLAVLWEWRCRLDQVEWLTEWIEREVGRRTANALRHGDDDEPAEPHAAPDAGR